MNPRHKVATQADLLLATAVEARGRWRGRLIRRARLAPPEIHDCDTEDDSEGAAIERATAMADLLFPIGSRKT